MQNLDSSQTKQLRTIACILAVLWAIVIFILSAIPGESYPKHPGFLNYFAHFGEYLIFGVLLTVAFTGGKLKSWHVLLIVIIIASAYGASDEFHQLFVPGRLCDPVDWLIDTLGASTGALLTSSVLKRANKPKDKR